LVRRLEDGTMRTVQAQSPRGAMRVFAAQYGPPRGEAFAVKARGSYDDWEVFAITATGIRSQGLASSADFRE